MPRQGPIRKPATWLGEEWKEDWHQQGRGWGLGPGACDRGWGSGVEDRLFLLIIYIDSSSSLGENNPNKLSKDVLDLIPASEAAR